MNCHSIAWKFFVYKSFIIPSKLFFNNGGKNVSLYHWRQLTVMSDCGQNNLSFANIGLDIKALSIQPPKLPQVLLVGGSEIEFFLDQAKARNDQF